MNTPIASSDELESHNGQTAIMGLPVNSFSLSIQALSFNLLTLGDQFRLGKM